jgi:dephospho-CoA kinase
MGLRIAFSAKAGSGKSEAIKIIKETLPANEIINVKFADDLYSIMYLVQDHLGIERHKDGKFLQIIGTEWGRNKDKNLWINRFKEKVERISKENPNAIIVCDDVRMVNEFFCTQNLGFTMIRINRDLSLRESSLVGRNTNHSSETEQDIIPDESFDYVINNNGSIRHLSSQIRDIIYHETYDFRN